MVSNILFDDLLLSKAGTGARLLFGGEYFSFVFLGLGFSFS